MVTLRKQWTPYDTERLDDLMSKHPIDKVARILHRTRVAVLVKSKKLGIAKNQRCEWYTAEEASEILGMAPATLVRRIEANKLIACPHDSLRMPRKGKSVPWHINRKALRDYMRTYPEDMVGRGVDIIQVVEILAGINQKWNKQL